ncbi:MAG: hypothetical protein PHV37_10120 [Candidatus Gastranaerophilales bacterium]|nr:hypothetical protein [Candidatus Gastranaerophilales bacterium]
MLKAAKNSDYFIKTPKEVADMKKQVSYLINAKNWHEAKLQHLERGDNSFLASETCLKNIREMIENLQKQIMDGKQIRR